MRRIQMNHHLRMRSSSRPCKGDILNDGCDSARGEPSPASAWCGPRPVKIWSGCRDMNPGPPAPKAGALSGLRYIPLRILAELNNFPKLHSYDFLKIVR